MARKRPWYWIGPIALLTIVLILAGCPSPVDPAANGGGGDDPASDSPKTTYSVVYNANDADSGTVPTDNTEYAAGATVTVAANTGSLVRDGFTFGGWNTTADGTGTNYSEGDTFVLGSANVSLYAQWSTTSAAGAVGGSAYAHLEFEYYGGASTYGYNTDVSLYPSASSFDPQLYLWINDESNSSAIDPGTYTLDLSGGVGTLEDVFIVFGTDYAATVFDQATFESYVSFSPTVYDQIISGSVTVSVSGSIYAFQWNLGTADGDTLSGSYSGPVDGGDIPADTGGPSGFSVTYEPNGATGIQVDSNLQIPIFTPEEIASSFRATPMEA